MRPSGSGPSIGAGVWVDPVIGSVVGVCGSGTGRSAAGSGIVRAPRVVVDKQGRLMTIPSHRRFGKRLPTVSRDAEVRSLLKNAAIALLTVSAKL
ncbi:hypothetical protein GCM10027059_24410 [Myceligenerans halotolerans]